MHTIIYTPEDEKRLTAELKDLVDTMPCHYGKMIKSNKRKYLLEYVNSKTPLLQNPEYNITTKVYWILHALVDFPICPTCGNQIIANVSNIMLGYSSHCSSKCAAISPVVRAKTRQTCLDIYGVTSVFNSDAVKDKIKIACLEKYGVENPMQSQVIKDRSKRTCLAKYGVEHSFQSDNNIKKSRQTCMKRYGVSSATKADETKTKTKLTMLERYGVENSMQYHPSRIKQQRKYVYQDISFDSLPEIALYIYLKDHNVDFEYQPEAAFWYSYNNKKHKYMPDFKIGDYFVEIKGDHMLNKETGTWVNPWNHSLDTLYESKHQCCLTNNVKIMYTEDYQQYLDYITSNYGRDYLKQFKNKPYVNVNIQQ